MEDKYAQLRESLKNGEFDFGAECCGNGVWDTPDNPPECCGQPITYTEMIQSLLDERDVLAEESKEQSRLLGVGSEREARLVTERNALRDALEIISDVYSYDVSLGEASLSLNEASNIAKSVLKNTGGKLDV